MLYYVFLISQGSAHPYLQMVGGGKPFDPCLGEVLAWERQNFCYMELISVLWGSAISGLLWKNGGYKQQVFKSSCTVTYLTTDVIASLMLCLKMYLDPII